MNSSSRDIQARRSLAGLTATGSDAPASASARVKGTVNALAASVFAVVVIGCAIAWIVAPTTTAGVIASGADTGSYMLTTRFIVDSLREFGRLLPINPAWYAGFAAFHNTPMLAYPPLVLAYLMTGDLNSASHVGHYIFAILAGIAVFPALRRRYSILPAAVGSLMFGAAPLIISQITSGGSYPRSLATALGAACFYFVDVMAERGVRPRYALPTALLLAASITAHPMIGVAFMSCWTVFFIVRATTGRTFSLGAFARWLGVMAAAFALSAWYLVPFFAEQQGWTSTPDQVFGMHSVEYAQGVSLLGWPLLALAAYGLVAEWKSPTVKAMFATGLLGLWLSGGIYAGLYVLIPAIKAAYPWTFLLFTVLALAVIAAAGLESFLRKPQASARTVLALFAALAVVTTIVQARGISVNMAQAPTAHATDEATAARVQELPGDGRVMVMHHPFGYLVYWVAGFSGKQGVEGLYYSLTPIGRQIAWTYDAIDHGFPEYAVDAFDRWNVRSLVANGNFAGEPYDRFAEALVAKGFAEQEPVETNRILFDPTAPHYVAPVQAQTLAIGRHAATAAMMIPGAVVGGSPAVDDYSAEFLESFDTIILAGFSTNDRAEAEALVSEFAAEGGNLVIDLNGMSVSAIEDTPGFLHVKGYPRVTEENLALRLNEQGLGGTVVPTSIAVPPAKPVETDEVLDDWRYMAYLGLDRSIADEAGGDGMSLLGTKTLEGGGQAVFVGGNLFYHAFRTGDTDEVALVRAIADPSTWGLEPRAAAKRTAAELRIDEAEADTGDRIAFDYTAATSTHALVSYAFSPHWNAYVDDQPAETYNIENLLVVALPSGAHSVELRYEWLGLHTAAVVVSAIALLMLGFAFWREHVRSRSARNEESRA